MTDAATTARKILSCVARVEQRFGAGHVVNVLRGRAVEAVTSRGHDRLSTFGLLAGASVTDVRGFIEQMTAQGLLRMTDDAYPVLRITPAGADLLKTADSDVTLVRPRQPESRAAARSRVEAESWQGVDRDLFERLRALRLEIARARHVPPYVIFHDTTLREMARQKPSTLADLRQIYGVGERKGLELGPQFLALIQSAQRPPLGV